MQDPAPSSTQETGTRAGWPDDNALLAHLLQQAADGSAAAFEQLYDRTARWLLAEVRRYVRDGQAEDVLAETYFQVWRSLHAYDAQRAPPAAWLRLNARSRALDHLRRERRRGSQQGDGAHEAVQQHADQAAGPEEQLARAETHRLLHASMSGPALSAAERTVLGLAYFREHTQREIAAITGFPLGTVKAMMARAQDKLRPAFGDPD